MWNIGFISDDADEILQAERYASLVVGFQLRDVDDDIRFQEIPGNSVFVCLTIMEDRHQGIVVVEMREVLQLYVAEGIQKRALFQIDFDSQMIEFAEFPIAASAETQIHEFDIEFFAPIKILEIAERGLETIA